MGYFLYAHGGSGDHSSEDRIRGTCRLLPCRPELVTADPMGAYRYGLAALADISRQPAVCRDDTCLVSIPGSGPGRRILWCWPDTALPAGWRKPETVVVTNTDAYQSLQRSGLGKSVHLGPDPCFLVDKTPRPVGSLFRRDTIGLCLSGKPRRYERRDGLLYASYCHMIQHLLNQTVFDLVLIPYCCSRRRNDSLLLTALYRQFQHTGRVFLRPDGDSPSLRGDLAECRFVIGSTGAMAAWSCGVPALCIGADPGAMGLAADLFGDWQDGVLPVAWIKEEADLAQAVLRFLRREDALRRMMATTVPFRRQRSQSWDWSTLSLSK